MTIEYTSDLSVRMCKDNPDKLFIFGDNLAGYGTAGQAVIRRESNSFGIPTKRYPSMKAGSFFTDRACEREHVLKALRELYTYRRRTIVFPRNGIGTGMAKMDQTSPLLFSEMNDILFKHFGIKNGK